MRCAVIGAGVCGLTCADKLAAGGVGVTVLEQKPFVGGLAATVALRSGFRFDLGGHRFYTTKRELMELFKGALGDEVALVRRVSRIYRDDKFFLYPVKLGDVLPKLGPLRAAGMVSDYFLARARFLFTEPRNFEEWVVSRFGRALYRFNFEEYSRKVWGIEPSELSRDWASQRIRGLSLVSALKNALFPPKRVGRRMATVTDHFYYPRRGIGRFTERLAERVEERGGSVLVGADVTAVRAEGKRVVGVETADGRSHAFDFLVSSMPVTSLLAALDPPPPAPVVESASRLAYRDLVLVFLALRRERVTGDSWIYFPDDSVPFARWHEPKNWSPEMVPAGDTTSLVVEYFCSGGDAVWREADDALAARTVEIIESRFGFLKRRDLVESRVVRVKRAYPIWHVGYERPLGVVMDYLDRYENLLLVGRSGRFYYNLMEAAMEVGLSAAQSLLDGVRYDLDVVARDGRYTERGTLPLLGEGAAPSA